MSMVNVLTSLNDALTCALERDEGVILLGEDLLDPYGGAFKVTRGLSTAFPGRVIATPISEAGIAGVAAGMAMRGLRPVVEIMFGDFLTLTADAIINHIAKFRWMYRLEEGLPLVIRTPMGGRRGYGPTHSQTLEKLFLGVPGLRVLAPNSFQDPGRLLLNAVLHTTDPVLFVENKLLYQLNIADPLHLADFELSEIDETTVRLRVKAAPAPQMTLASYGYMSEITRQAMLRLAYEREIFTELLVLSQIAPFQNELLLESIRKTGRLVTVEEGGLTLGWGAEVLARAAETLGSELRAAQRVAALDLPVPASSPLEKAVLPDVEQIIQAVVHCLSASNRSTTDASTRTRPSP